MVFVAIGQKAATKSLGGAEVRCDRDGRIVVDEERRTRPAGVWAGGDCVAGGLDLTVNAVEDGKRAARSVDAALKSTAPELQEDAMVDLSANFVGIKSPNPFWLASAPPTDCKINVERAFRAGWGGVVWKT